MITTDYIKGMTRQAIETRDSSRGEQGDLKPLFHRNLCVFWEDDRGVIYTSNSEYDGYGNIHYHLTTNGGLVVNWYYNDIGIANGASFFPTDWWSLPWKVASDI